MSNGHADPEAAWDKAVAALTDPNGRFLIEPRDVGDLLDSTWGRHLADQVAGRDVREAIEEIGRRRGWARDAHAFVRRHIRPDARRRP